MALVTSAQQGKHWGRVNKCQGSVSARQQLPAECLQEASRGLLPGRAPVAPGQHRHCHPPTAAELRPRDSGTHSSPQHCGYRAGAGRANPLVHPTAPKPGFAALLVRTETIKQGNRHWDTKSPQRGPGIPLLHPSSFC